MSKTDLMIEYCTMRTQGHEAIIDWRYDTVIWVCRADAEKPLSFEQYVARVHE